MKTKNLVRAAILLALGTVLHFVVPGIFNGMKPDFLLVTMFVAIMLNPDVKSTFVITMAGGVLTALTTTFPGGQVPSLLDKFISGFAFLAMYNLFFKNLKKQIIGVTLNIFINTLISGIVFLESAVLLTGFEIPGGIGVLLFGLVLPTAVFNGIFGMILYKVMSVYKKAVRV